MQKHHKSSLCNKAAIFDEAFITSITRYKDSDCIVRLFAKNFGRMDLFFPRGFKTNKSNSIIQKIGRAHV